MTIRRGSISGPGFKAKLYKGGDAAFRGRIAVERGSGMIEFPSVAQLPRILREEGIAVSAAEQAFGRGKLKANGDEDAPTLKYGSRRMKLGHVGPHGIVLGTKRRSLVLLDTKNGTPVWGAIEDPPGTIRNLTTNRVLSLDSVFAKAKVLKIPPQAVYDAFGHLMSAEDKRALLVSFHKNPYRTSAAPKPYRHGAKMRAKRAVQRAGRSVRRWKRQNPAWPAW